MARMSINFRENNEIELSEIEDFIGAIRLVKRVRKLKQETEIIYAKISFFDKKICIYDVTLKIYLSINRDL